MPLVSLVPLAFIAAAVVSTAAAMPAVRMVRTLPADSVSVDVAADVLPNAPGALIAGWTTRGQQPPDGFLIQVDRDGSPLWRRELGASGLDILFAVQPDGAGGYLCAGFTGGRGAGGTDGWVVRVDSTGQKTWERTFGESGDERLTSLQPTARGWMLAGHRVRAGDTDAWVLQLDRAGREIASWTWGGPGVQRGLGVEPMADGGCVIVGGSASSDADGDGFITRLDSGGREVWTRTIGGAGRQVAYHLRPMTGGGVLMTGYGFENEARDFDMIAMRLGPDGRVIYDRRLGGAGSTDRAVQSAVLEDGSVVVVGYTKAVALPDDAPVWQTVLHGLDAQGTPTWSLSLGGLGRESGRWVTGRGGDLWVVSQSAETDRSRVVVARLDVRAP